MSIANVAARLVCMLACSCVASRVHHSKLSTRIQAPGNDIPALGTCDPSTIRLQVGDDYTVRSFMQKDMFGKEVGEFANYVNIMGHQYIEILARDALAESCLATFGLYIWGDDVGIQSPDWGVAVNSKKIANCVKDGSTLETCVNESSDIMGDPLELDSPHSPTRTFIARGTKQYSGKLSDKQMELLLFVLSQAKPSTHDFLGKPVVMMSVRKGCQPGTIGPMINPGEVFGWKCNCMTFTNEFRKTTTNLLAKFHKLVELLESMKVPATEDLTTAFGEHDTIQRGDASYKCCCTELNWKTYCKLEKLEAKGASPPQLGLSNLTSMNKHDALEGIGNLLVSSATKIVTKIKDVLPQEKCSGLDKLNFKFHSWNSAVENNGNIENSGRCMVALDDPLLSQVAKGD